VRSSENHLVLAGLTTVAFTLGQLEYLADLTDGDVVALPRWSLTSGARLASATATQTVTIRFASSETLTGHGTSFLPATRRSRCAGQAALATATALARTDVHASASGR